MYSNFGHFPGKLTGLIEVLLWLHSNVHCNITIEKKIVCPDKPWHYLARKVYVLRPNNTLVSVD